jgi:hypothetical protein
MWSAPTGEQRVEALGLVNAIVGAGKDAQARTYVAQSRLLTGRAVGRTRGDSGHPPRAPGLIAPSLRRPDCRDRKSRRHHPLTTSISATLSLPRWPAASSPRWGACEPRTCAQSCSAPRRA